MAKKYLVHLLMIFYYLLFQIFISWSIAYIILGLVNKITFVSYTDVYREAKLITSFFKIFNVHLSIQHKLFISRILHHITGMYFISVYYVMWYYEFTEISWKMSFLIGIVISLVRFMSWIFLLEIFPSSRTSKFKGYYLQHVFLHNTFTIMILSAYLTF